MGPETAFGFLVSEPTSLSCFSLSHLYVHAKGNAAVGIEGDEFFAQSLCGNPVHANEEIEFLGMEIGKETYACGKIVDAQAQAAIKPACRGDVAKYASFCPGIWAIDVQVAHKAEFQGTV